jgi:anti-anti-sigma factor
MAVTPEIGDGVLEAVRHHEPGCVIVDLSRVTYMDSSGIHLLFRLHSEIASAGAELIVVAPPGSNPARLIELVALTDAGEVRPSVESALDSCAGRRTA